MVLDAFEVVVDGCRSFHVLVTAIATGIKPIPDQGAEVRIENLTNLTSVTNRHA